MEIVYKGMYRKKIILLIMLTFCITGCKPLEEQAVDLQIVPSLIPSQLLVGESVDITFLYPEYEEVAGEVEIWTDTPNNIRIENMSVIALEPGIATINSKYPTTIDPYDNTTIDYNYSTTEIYVFEGRISKDWIRETTEMIDFSRGTNYEDLLELKFSEYKTRNNSEIVRYSDGGRIILYENTYFFMTIKEILDKNPEYSLENFIIDGVQFEHPDNLHLKGFIKTHNEIIEEPNWTDSGVKNNLIDTIKYDCGIEKELIVNIEGTIKSTSSTDNEVCKQTHYW